MKDTTKVNRETFEEYLQNIHAEQYNGLDDDMPDSYADWVGALDPNEVIEWAETYGQQQRQLGEQEIVICAAVRASDGYIVRGNRHANALRALQDMPKYKQRKEHPHGDNQGFITSKNRYVTRKEGCEIQKKAGIESKMPDGQKYLSGELYSEDLY